MLSPLNDRPERHSHCGMQQRIASCAAVTHSQQQSHTHHAASPSYMFFSGLLDRRRRSAAAHFVRVRRGRFVLLFILVVLVFVGYVFVVDDAMLPDDVLETLVPKPWSSFRDAAPLGPGIARGDEHPLLARHSNHSLRSSISSTTVGPDGRSRHPTLADVEDVVRRWNALPRDISDALGSPQPRVRPRKAWNGHRGVFLVTKGDGNLARYDAQGGWRHYRLRKQVVKYVIDAIGRHVQTANVMFHIGVDDNDVFHALHVYSNSAFAAACWQIIVDSPFLYFVHWNPFLYDATRGLIGPRMIPIPDYEHIYIRNVAVTPPKRLSASMSQRPSVVFRWRGGTTGAFQSYKDSDRYRIVALMNLDPAFVNVSDVKFDGVGGESVKGDEIPPSFVGPSQNQEAMSDTWFHLDIDGNANSWRGTRWKMASGIPVIKSRSPFIQWYYPLLRDDEHVLMWDLDNPPSRHGGGQHVADESAAAAKAKSELERLDVNKAFLIEKWQEARSDFSDFTALAERAGTFAKALFHRKAAEGYIYDAFQHLALFDLPIDWRIRNSARYALSEQR